MKLSKHVQPHLVGEYLRSMGAEGGEEIEDAASVAQQSAEDSVEDEEQQMPNPNPMMGQQPPPDPMGMGEQMPLTAGKDFGKVFNLLYEATFFKPKKPKKVGKSARPGRRTGKYWLRLEKAVGKNRQKINEKDVLKVRSRYAKKPNSADRNQVLRDLDKAFSYFHRRLKEEGGVPKARRFAEEYYAVDNLKPQDYSEETISLEKMQPAEEPPNIDFETSQLNQPDFTDILGDEEEETDDEETYDDIEIENPTY